SRTSRSASTTSRNASPRSTLPRTLTRRTRSRSAPSSSRSPPVPCAPHGKCPQGRPEVPSDGRFQNPWIDGSSSRLKSSDSSDCIPDGPRGNLMTEDKATGDAVSSNPERSPTLASVFSDALRDPASRTTLFGAFGAAVLLTVIFWSNSRHFLYSWSTDESYSHGFLVPFISLYFANLAAARGRIRNGGGVVVGTLLLVLAVLVKLATVVIVVGTLGDLALLSALAGTCALLCGREALRRYGFALGFLVFMVPLPVALYALIASPLQLMVSQFSSFVLNSTGVPVLT